MNKPQLEGLGFFGGWGIPSNKLEGFSVGSLLNANSVWEFFFAMDDVFF